MRVCSYCGESKDESEYYSLTQKKKDGSNYLFGECKVCHNTGTLGKYHKKTKEEKLERSRRNREQMGRAYFQNWRLVNDYGITLEEFHQRVDEQNHQCYICDKTFESKKDTRVDHDHATGRVRKILCHNCNSMLGHAKENIETLRKAIEYIREHK